jgi:hypothetical protein
MTLCAAWIRHGHNKNNKSLVFATDSRLRHDEELIFATDSRLRGGEAWDYGLKLFDLGRSDSLICFAGATRRAYPLILQAMNSIHSNIEWTDPRLDVYDILSSLCSLFTEICKGITDLPDRESVHALRSEAEFLFGGWSWRAQHFGIWRVFYSEALQAFSHYAVHDQDMVHVFCFLSRDEFNGSTITAEAERMLDEKLFNAGRRHALLDMEPLSVLVQMSRDDTLYPSVGGALQIGKVYRSGRNEFFGIVWPSISDGRPHFMGKPINLYDAPPLRFFDPDTGGLIEHLPGEFWDVEQFDFGEEKRFIQNAYPEHKLRSDLSEAHRLRLNRIFQDAAYRQFVQAREVARDATAPPAISEVAHD